MEPLPGFVSIPRLAGIPRPAGAFFSAVVVGPAGPGHWRVTLDGKAFVVASTLDLTAGQVLKLRLVSQTGGRWLFQTVPPGSSAPEQPSTGTPPALLAAFLSRGLPAAVDRLGLWTRWLAARPSGPHDRESWAASLEARGAGPQAPLAQAIEPWLAWQTALESGESPELPEDGCWDEWNLRRPRDGAPWLVMPLRWEYQGQGDAGLLQAHWNPQGQTIDRWHLTAAPASTPFRMEARVRPRQLDLTWRFFRTEDRVFWNTITKAPEFPGLSSADLAVNLVVAGVEPGLPPPYRGGIDVEA